VPATEAIEEVQEPVIQHKKPVKKPTAIKKKKLIIEE